jgi:FkbH-like protein
MNKKLSQCARAIRSAKNKFVNALILGIEEPRLNRFEEPAEIYEARVHEELELLCRYLEGNKECGFLYSGQRIFELHHAERTVIENIETSRKRLDEDRLIFLDNLKPLINSDLLQEFESAYNLLTSWITIQSPKHLRTLFIGDCLMMEIMTFLVSPLRAEGIAIDSFPIHSRDPSKLRSILSKIADNEIDVIFVSPFSHSRLPEIKRLLNPNGMLSSSELKVTIQNILEQTQLLLDLLSDRFSCPIYIHNALLIPRSTSWIKMVVRSSFSWYRRLIAGRRINQWITAYISEKNQSTFQHLFLLDENALTEKFGRYQLGRYLHTSKFQHATVLSQKLSIEYQERIGALAQFSGKKLILCDPDEVLWDTSKVEKENLRYQGRQALLSQLKQYGGVVLTMATNKTSDAVSFNGSLIKRDDFIASQFNSSNKTKAIEMICNQLNLQTRHMLFIHDSKAERDLIKTSFPDILVLDSCDIAAWNRMQLWADTIHGSSEIDRTKLYHEQEQRDIFVEINLKERRAADQNALEKLGLIISIKEAKKNELKRTIELINRTNQWNLCGSRTNLEQVQAWHESKNAQILLASAQDRFGDMGIVCIAVITTESEKAEIPIFVLSCRVFGYGVESAMLDEVARRCFTNNEITNLVGHYRPTNQNHLCRDMYLEYGFQRFGELFVMNDKNTVPLAS